MKIKSIFFAALLIFIGANASAQADTAIIKNKFIETYAYKISKHTLEDHVKALCVPEMEGRKLGTTGSVKAQSYIISQLKKHEVATTNADWYEQFFNEYGTYGVNIIGKVEGSEDSEKNVIIAAHYDGIGADSTGQFMACADDNATGVAALIEIAGALSNAAKHGIKPKYDIYFIAFDGSKQGLLGSRHYYKFPIKMLSDTQMLINMDMIGRADCGMEKDNQNYVFLLGNPSLPNKTKKIIDSINTMSSQLKIEYNLYNNQDIFRLFYPTSDHYNFAGMLPTIFCTGGINADVHSAGDTPEKISYSTLRSRALLVLYTAWHYANL